MPYLDPRVRCNGCGEVLSDETVPACPGCGADLARVGTACELREWGTIRRRGRTRYVWLRWVLGWGGLLAGVQCAAYAWRGERDPGLYALTLLWPLGGYISGQIVWHRAEREYAARASRPADPRHT